MILKPYKNAQLLPETPPSLEELDGPAVSPSSSASVALDLVKSILPAPTDNPQQKSNSSKRAQVENLLTKRGLGLEQVIAQMPGLLASQDESVKFRTVRTLLEMHDAIPKPETDNAGAVIQITVQGDPKDMMGMLLPQRPI